MSSEAWRTWAVFHLCSIRPRAGSVQSRRGQRESVISPWITVRFLPAQKVSRLPGTGFRLFPAGRTVAGQPAGAPGGLEVVAADGPVEVEQLAGEEQARHEL